MLVLDELSSLDIPFQNKKNARLVLDRLARLLSRPELLDGFLSHLLYVLETTSDPDRVLVNLERMAQASDQPQEFLTYLARNQRTLEILFRVFDGSQFLTEILLRNPEYFDRLADIRHLVHPLNTSELIKSADAWISSASTFPEKIDALRGYQRVELLRIGAGDLLGQLDLDTVTQQLSNLANAQVQLALILAAQAAGIELTDSSLAGFVVIALGKLGGHELNYSSDIDLLFIASPDASRFQRMAQKLIEALAAVTAEGFLYRVDMRLRPWGSSGPLVSSMDGYLAYLRQHARLWEKQALLKASPIAGDISLGQSFIKAIQPCLFQNNTEHADKLESVRSMVHAMKQRTEAYLREQGRNWGEVKLGEGSIRDVEFVTQFLQLANGEKHPSVLNENTLEALTALYVQGFLPYHDYRILKDGYVFLRSIEHHLQMMHYQQQHTLPETPQALLGLARRLGFGGEDAGERFNWRYQQYRAAVRGVYLRYMIGDESAVKPMAPVEGINVDDISSHIRSMDGTYAMIFSPQEISQHALMAERLSENRLVEMKADQLDERVYRLTIVAFDYLGELSLICGLLFAYRCNIIEGDVYTYEPSKLTGGRRKIVDVFNVELHDSQALPSIWETYRNDLERLLRMMHSNERRAARGELAKRVALALETSDNPPSPEVPLWIGMDNDSSEHYTVLRIRGQDTLGFLYELTNALASSRIHIARMLIESSAGRVYDTLYVTDAQGRKITQQARQRELRATVALIKHFTHLLPYAANPEAALLHFRELVENLLEQPDWPDKLVTLERPEVLGALAKLLGVSDFLWEDFLRLQHENLFPVVSNLDGLIDAFSPEQLQDELDRELQSAPEQDWRKALNDFKDRVQFRIDMRNILGYTVDFTQFSQELTDLVEIVVRTAYRLSQDELTPIYGLPLQEDARVCPACFCALGKIGGREPGVASDIELMFLYDGRGWTNGPKRIQVSEFFEKLVENFLTSIRARQEGIFHVDLQLRPYGKAGMMAIALDTFQRYYAPDGPAWPYERQALVKLRFMAGDLELGHQVETLRDQFVYTGEPFDVAAMRAMRERQVRHLVSGGTFNAKFSPGGLSDIEYLVQGLQISHGYCDSTLRLTNTRAAMAAMHEAGIIPLDDYARLRKAHTFLRWLIDSLRLVRGNAKDLTVPAYESDEFAFLARRLRYEGDREHLRAELLRYPAEVLDVQSRLFNTPIKPC